MMEAAKAFCICSLFLLTAQPVAGCTGANANPQSLTDTGNVEKGVNAEGSASRERRPAVDAKGEIPAAAVSADACLKEGEFCNPLNDQCCAGLYCPGGLAPRCFRKL